MAPTPNIDIRRTELDAQSVIYKDMQEGEVDEVIEFLHEDFFQREPLAHGLHLTPEDVQDWIVDAVHYWQSTGVSVVAREQRTGALVGVLLSLVLTKDGDQSLLIDRSKNEPSLAYQSMVTQLAAGVDVYEQFLVDTVLDLIFLSVKKTYGCRGIATRLCKESERRGQSVGCQAATVAATNIFTQRIFDRLGYQTIAELPMTDFKYGGVPCVDSATRGDNISAKMMVRKFV